jgi:hypothetical protein
MKIFPELTVPMPSTIFFTASARPIYTSVSCVVDGLTVIRMRKSQIMRIYIVDIKS